MGCYAEYYNHAHATVDPASKLEYTSLLGRWISRDPIGEDAGTNLYQYVSNNPISNWDPLGLKDWSAAQVQKMLDKACSDATADWLGAASLGNIFNNSHPNGPMDYAYGPKFNDRFILNDEQILSASEFGNYIAGYQAGAYDQNYGGHLAEGITKGAGIAMHTSTYLNGKDVPGFPALSREYNDPWDFTGMPAIQQGIDAGQQAAKSNCKCKGR